MLVLEEIKVSPKSPYLTEVERLPLSPEYGVQALSLAALLNWECLSAKKKSPFPYPNTTYRHTFTNFPLCTFIFLCYLLVLHVCC